jgi:glycosyltransferase involved in cell wall biosynthesis
MAEIGWKVKQKTGVKFILDLHENYPEAVLHYKWANKTWKKWLAKPYKWAINEKRLLAYADKIIVVHDDLQTCLVDKYPELSEKISIFPNVPDLEEFSSYPTDINVFEKGNKFVLFYFGIISEQRGIVTCVNAINVLKLIYPNIHLLLIGPILNSEKTIFRDILDNDHITHLDWIDISLFPSYAHISDVCINPLRKIKAHETTFANKIYQYALSQKPLLVSDCKPLKDIIEKYNCGLVFKADDTTDLANKIEYLLNNPDKCEEYGKNGRKAVMEKYNVKMLGMNLLASYR